MPKKVLILSLISILAIGTVFSLLFAGSYLIKSDKLQKADAIVVPMGSIPDRLLYASDLYQQGWAGKVIFVEEYNESLNLLKSRGITIKSSSQQMANAAIQLGIHPDNLIIIPGDAQSTQMEAQQLHQFLEGNNQILKLDTLSGELVPITAAYSQSYLNELDTMIFVTSPSHTRRAYRVFVNEFKHAESPMVFLVSPSPYDSYTGKAWFKSREEIQIVVTEWIKRIGG